MLTLALLLAAAPLEVSAALQRDEQVEARLVAPNSRVIWHALLKADASTATTECRPAHHLELRSIASDGTVSSVERVEFPLAEYVRCEASYVMPGVVIVERNVHPPPTLKASLVDADDITGFGTWVIENGSTEPLELVDVAVMNAALGEVRSAFGENFGDCSAPQFVGPGQTTRVSISESVCPQARVGTFVRRLTLEHRKCLDSTRYDFFVSFEGRRGDMPVLLPKEKFHRMYGSDDILFPRGLLLEARDGALACACEGNHVGVLRHVVMRQGMKLCALAPGTQADQCERPLSRSSNSGDFPDLPPFYRLKDQR